MFMKYKSRLLGTKLEIEYTKECVDLMEELIEKYRNQVFIDLEEEAKSVSEEIAEQLYDYNHDVVWNLKDSFPQRLRRTIFVSSHSILEVGLNNLCEDMGKDKKIKSENSWGRNIEKARKYLKEDLEIDFPDDSEEWKFLKQCNKVRNILVHNLGKVNSNKKRHEWPKKFILKHPRLISLIDWNNIKLQDIDNSSIYNDTNLKPTIYDIKLEKEFMPYYLKVLDDFIIKLNNVI